MTEAPIKRRKPWLALLLSFLTPGWGQFYNGQWKKGLLFFILEAIGGCVSYAAMGEFATAAMAFGTLMLLSLFIAGEAYFTARSHADYPLQQCNKWWVYTTLVVAGLMVSFTMEVTVRSQWYKPYKVPTGSMLQTLQIGDRFIAEILDEDDTLSHGQIAVFIEPGSTNHFVKRIIGLPGERIFIRNKEVFVNDIPLDEPYVQHTKTDFQPQRDNFGPYRLKNDEYFLMGDNREKSYDSRFFGPINRNKIVAKAAYIFFPGHIGSEAWFSRLGQRLN